MTICLLERLRDSKTSTTTSTRFNLKAFSRILKIQTPFESFILPFFTRKVSTVPLMKEVTPSPDRKMIKRLTFDNFFPSLRHSR